MRTEKNVGVSISRSLPLINNLWVDFWCDNCFKFCWFHSKPYLTSYNKNSVYCLIFFNITFLFSSSSNKCIAISWLSSPVVTLVTDNAAFCYFRSFKCVWTCLNWEKVFSPIRPQTNWFWSANELPFYPDGTNRLIKYREWWRPNSSKVLFNLNWVIRHPTLKIPAGPRPPWLRR